MKKIIKLSSNIKQTLTRVALAWIPAFLVLLFLLFTVENNRSLWVAVGCIVSVTSSYFYYLFACFRRFDAPSESQFPSLLAFYIVVGLMVISVYALYYFSFNLAHLYGLQSPDKVSLMGDLGLSIYFSITTFTTLGYGDITPSFSAGQYIAASQAFIGTVHMVSFLALWLSKRSI